MKKYLLFAGDDYYPQGGFNDFITESDSLEELKSLIRFVARGNYVYIAINHEKWNCDSPSDQWLEIIDRDSKEVVYQDSTRNYYHLKEDNKVNS